MKELNKFIFTSSVTIICGVSRKAFSCQCMLAFLGFSQKSLSTKLLISDSYHSIANCLVQLVSKFNGLSHSLRVVWKEEEKVVEGSQPMISSSNSMTKQLDVGI